jgi:hypothetical protein
MDPWMKAIVEQHLAAARAQTDPAEWEAWAAGSKLSIEQAAAEVLTLASSSQKAPEEGRQPVI